MQNKSMLVLSALLSVSAFMGVVQARQPQVADTLLFTIHLTDDDQGSLFHTGQSGDMRSHLTGPVFMSGNRLLFYSKHGYVLYDLHGNLIEQHSLVRENTRAAAAGRPQKFLAYPFDGETLIYYTETDPVAVYRKRLQRPRFEEVPQAEMDLFRNIESEPFNIYRGSTTEDITRKANLRPHLVGYNSLVGGSNWWSTDQNFNFTSPIIMETNGRFASFFPGFREDMVEGHCGDPTELMLPLGAFQRNGRWYYLGLYSVSIGTEQGDYFQTIMLIDQSGNVLYCSRLFKHGLGSMAQEQPHDIDVDDASYIPARYVFLPVVDHFGDLYYGVLDREYRAISVRKKSFYRFLSIPAAPAYADRFDTESRLGFNPVRVECAAASHEEGVLPPIFSINDQGGRNMLDLTDLTVDSFYAKVHRLPDEELWQRVRNVASTMPSRIAMMQDSIAQVRTMWCPYGISINHEVYGQVASLSYGLGDVVVSARVLGVSESQYVYVRVDLESWAEVVVFTHRGRFVERFIFNRQNFEQRQDVLVMAPNDAIYERDYEAGLDARGQVTAGHRFIIWRKDVVPLPREEPPPERKRRWWSRRG
ncbi:MAG: hypothetical protein LBC70_07225 [Chitinispirillales bacterium]|nr:hypothetical protein [Chitinispirillales bacterium]